MYCSVLFGGVGLNAGNVRIANHFFTRRISMTSARATTNPALLTTESL